MTDHYETLGVPKDASPEDIKRAFRKQSSQHHPDKPGGSDEAMAKVNAAYAVLSDPARRLGYDQTGRDPAEGPTLDDIAEHALQTLIQQILEDSPKGDLVKHLEQHITKSIEQLQAQVKKHERAIARLTKQLDRVVRKSAGRTSLFNAVLEKQIKQARDFIEEADRLMEVSQRSLEILRDHEDTKPEVEPQVVSKHAAVVDEVLRYHGYFG